MSRILTGHIEPEETRKVVHARWVESHDDEVFCSYCLERFYDPWGEKESYRYCPHCGSTMDLNEWDMPTQEPTEEKT